MLLQVGPLQFTIDPLNAHAIERSASTEFAKKDVIGRRKIYEHTGEGDDRYTVHGRLFPYKLGGLGALALAHTVREQASPQMVVRGDGKVLGWFVITEITERQEYLAGDGVGQMIEMELIMERADSPTPQGYFSSLMGLAP
jgi:phage protein U